MSAWLELHCDARLTNPDPVGVSCLTNDNEHPGCLVGNAAGDVAEGLRFLKAKAKNEGWRYSRKDGWTCARCVRIEEDADKIPYKVTIVAPHRKGFGLSSNCYTKTIFARSEEEAGKEAMKNMIDGCEVASVHEIDA